MSELLAAVESIGFPAVVSILLFRQYREERASRQEEREAWRDALDSLGDKLGEVHLDVQRLATDGGSDDD